MAVEVIKNLKLDLNGVTVGCARNVSWGASREKVSAQCQASGDAEESRPGLKTYTMSVEALARVATGVDEAGQSTFVNIEQLFEAGTIFDFEVGPDEVGATKKSGTCYVLSYEETSALNGEATWSAEFAVTGEVTYTENV